MPDPGYFAKLRLFLSGHRARGRHRQANRASRRPARHTSSFVLESLEPRVLLAADLTGVLGATTQLDPAVPTTAATAIVQVLNQGNARANATTQVAVYASLNSTFEPTDVLLGTANTAALNAGQLRNVNVNLTIPNSLAPGNYSLLSRVDATNVIAEGTAGEANNVAARSTQFEVAWKFGSVPGRPGSTNLTLKDADGNNVTFSLTGGGTGEVLRDGSQWDVRVTGTTAQSVFTIQTNDDDGCVTLDDIHVFGPLGAVNASTMDLVGTLAVDGPLTAGVLLGSANGAVIAAPTIVGKTVQGFTVQGIAILGNLTNSTILIGATLGQDGKLGGTGTNADTFTAGTASDFFIGGSMTASTVRVGQDPVDGVFDNGNDAILGGTSSNVRSIRINGTMSADSSFVAGSFPTTASIDGQSIATATRPLQFRTNLQGPTLTAVLSNDTGSSSTDGLTSNPAIAGTVTDPNGIATFVAGFGATPTFNVLSDRQTNGSFIFSQARLEQMNGGPLADGPLTLTLRATDTCGNATQIALTFTLDRTAPATLTFDLATSSDSPPVGDQQTTNATVTLTGQTEANTLVELLGLGFTTTANVTGAFSVSNVTLILGANSFTVRATDTAGNQRTVTRTITRTASNQPPVLNPLGNQTAPEEQLLSFTATATDSDLPANLLPFSVADGTSGLVPVGAAIDPTTGVFTWTPTEAQGPGTFTFDVVVSDGTATDAETITVTVHEVNQAPVLGAIGTQSIDEGTLLTFTATATDPDLPANNLTFSLAAGTSGLVPAGATINGSTGVFSWTPTEAQGPGTFTFDVVVSDGTATDAETITVTVHEVNQAPVLGAIGTQSIDEGTLLTFTATATDPDLPANLLTFSLADGTSGLVPAGATINSSTGVFSWTPTEAQGPGTFTFDVVVSDGTATDAETITVTVNEVNQAPVLGAIGTHRIDEGTLLSFTATATDPDLPANNLTFSLADGTSGLVPVGAAIDPTTGVFTWTPTEAQGPGTFTFDVVVSDGTATDAETITVTVHEVNAAPD